MSLPTVNLTGTNNAPGAYGGNGNAYQAGPVNQYQGVATNAYQGRGVTSTPLSGGGVSLDRATDRRQLPQAFSTQPTRSSRFLQGTLPQQQQQQQQQRPFFQQGPLSAQPQPYVRSQQQPPQPRTNRGPYSSGVFQPQNSTYFGGQPDTATFPIGSRTIPPATPSSRQSIRSDQVRGNYSVGSDDDDNNINTSALFPPRWLRAANGIPPDAPAYDGGVGWPQVADSQNTDDDIEYGNDNDGALMSSREMDAREVQQSDSETRAVTARLRAAHGISDTESATASIDDRPSWRQRGGVPFIGGPEPAAIVSAMSPRQQKRTQANGNNSCQGLIDSPSRRTLDNVVVLNPPPAQVIPVQWYSVRILGIDYTVIRYYGFSESAVLLRLTEQARLQRGATWNLEPIEIPVPDCGAPSPGPLVLSITQPIQSDTGYTTSAANGNGNGTRALGVVSLSGSPLHTATNTNATTAILTETGAIVMDGRRLRYADALFAAFAYQIDAIDGLDLEQIACFLTVATQNDLAVNAKTVLQGIATSTDTRDLAQVFFAVNTIGQNEPFLTTRPNNKSATYGRVLSVVQQILARAFDEHGFTPVALSMLASTAPADNPGWRDDLLVALGAAVAQATGLGTEPVTGALVESLLRPAMRVVDATGDAGVKEVASPAVRDMVQGASEYLSEIRVRQASLTVDRAVAERVFYWTSTIGPLDIDVERIGSCPRSRRYRSLVVAKKSCPTVLYYAERTAAAPPYCSASIEPVGGIQSLMDDWAAITIRPQDPASARALSLLFAPTPEYAALLQPVASESPFAFRVEKSQYLSSLLTNPTLAPKLATIGTLQGVSSSVG